MKELKKLDETRLIYFDIETAPLVKELVLDSPLFDSWAYKVRKKDDLTDAEVIESYSNQAGLYPEYAKIVSIAAGVVVDNRLYIKTYDNKDESVLLKEFNDFITKQTDKSRDTMLCGFANYGFDTPFCQKRMILNFIEPNQIFSGWDRKPWIFDEVDLKNIWKGTSWNPPSLISLAVALRIPSPKDDIGGADVGRVYWSEGAKGLERISKYCRKDVVTTFNIFKRLRFEDMLEVVVVKDAPEVVVPEEPFIIKLLNGGKFGKVDKDKLFKMLSTLPKDEQDKALAILTAASSKARGKVTKITTAHIKELKLKLKG